jgi:hypothetical protein
MANRYRSIPVLTQQQIDKFWSKVAKAGPDDCWPWQAYIAKKSRYGLTSIKKRKNYVVSRVAYFLHHGIDPGPNLVCHRCDVRHCCNPKHLFLGTDVENVRDMMAKGRGAFGKKAWSAQNPEHFAKLVAAEVLEMRGESRQGKTSAAIARERQLPYNTVFDLVHYKTWKHLP